MQALSKALDSDVIAKRLSSIITTEITAVIQKSNKEVIDAMEEKNREMKSLIHRQNEELKKKDEEIKHLKTGVLKLENENDALEQYTRRNSLRISGLPDPEPNFEDPVQAVLTLFNKTLQLEQSESPILLTDIDRVHRVGPKSPGHARQMLVKFANYRARQRVFKAKKNLKHRSSGADKPRGCTDPTPGMTPQDSDSKYVQSAAGRNIFINEDLTKTRVGLLYQARTAKREKRINDCWTVDGQILIKNGANKIIPIRNLEELKKIVE